MGYADYFYKKPAPGHLAGLSLGHPVVKRLISHSLFVLLLTELAGAVSLKPDAPRLKTEELRWADASP